MIHPGLHVIRPAGPHDAEALRRLAAAGNRRPIAGPALVGEIDGSVAAALSMADGSVVAHPAHPTAYLLACMRVRAGAMRAVEATPSLSARIRAAVPVAAAA